MSENTKPAADENNETETPEVEAHSVLDLQETPGVIDREIVPGNCVSTVSLVLIRGAGCRTGGRCAGGLPPARPHGHRPTGLRRP
ncbi:hypothetical protein ACWDB3_32645, partial [Streptomyces bacillaris]